MNQEERRHWASWIGTIAEGVAGVMAVDGGIPASQGVPDPGPSRTRRPLTETEKRIIEHQGTEPPFSGQFVSFFEQGTYGCRKCGKPCSGRKTNSTPDAAGPALTIPCRTPSEASTQARGRARRSHARRCGSPSGAHLHRRTLTPKNTRYCVNSLSLDSRLRRAGHGEQPPLTQHGTEKRTGRKSREPDKSSGKILFSRKKRASETFIPAPA